MLRIALASVIAGRLTRTRRSGRTIEGCNAILCTYGSWQLFDRLSCLLRCRQLGDCANCHGAEHLRSYVHCAAIVALSASVDPCKGSEVSQQRSQRPQPCGIYISALHSRLTALHLPVQPAASPSSLAEQTGSLSTGCGLPVQRNQSQPRPALQRLPSSGWLCTAKMAATSVTT